LGGGNQGSFRKKVLAPLHPLLQGQDIFAILVGSFLLVLILLKNEKNQRWTDNMAMDKANILIVEDEPANQRLLSFNLQRPWLPIVYSG
jgi:hypothetical protein